MEIDVLVAQFVSIVCAQAHLLHRVPQVRLHATICAWTRKQTHVIVGVAEMCVQAAKHVRVEDV